nr:MAG: capsid protein [Cressdnaviricota sp.]
MAKRGRGTSWTDTAFAAANVANQIYQSFKKPKPNPNGSGPHGNVKRRPKRKSRRSTSFTSSGDLQAKKYSKGKIPRAELKRKRKFKAKVITALEDELPSLRLLIPYATRQTVPIGSMYQFSDIAVMTQSHLVNCFNFNDNGGTGLSFPAEKIIITGYLMEAFMTNSSNDAIIVDWYRVKPRTDNSVLPSSDFYNALNRADNAKGELTTYASTAALSNKPGPTPFMSRIFTSKWNIVSKERWILQPYETKSFSASSKKKMTIEGSRLYSNDLSLVALKGLTEYYMYTVYGQPVHDPTTGNVSTGPCAVDYTVFNTYFIQSCPTVAGNTTSGQTNVAATAILPTVTAPVMGKELGSTEGLVAAVNTLTGG